MSREYTVIFREKSKIEICCRQNTKRLCKITNIVTATISRNVGKLCPNRYDTSAKLDGSIGGVGYAYFAPTGDGMNARPYPRDPSPAPAGGVFLLDAPCILGGRGIAAGRSRARPTPNSPRESRKSFLGGLARSENRANPERPRTQPLRAPNAPASPTSYFSPQKAVKRKLDCFRSWLADCDYMSLGISEMQFIIQNALRNPTRAPPCESPKNPAPLASGQAQNSPARNGRRG